MTLNSYLMVTWDNFYKLSFSLLKVNFTSLDKLLNLFKEMGILIKWYGLKKWEEMDDIKIYEYIKKIQEPKDELYVVTEVCYRKSFGPIAIDGGELQLLVEEHLAKYNECFFNGDVAIFSLKYRKIWIFHHEGMFAFVEM
jgi:hypothetical protein